MKTEWSMEPLSAVADSRLGKMLDQKKSTGRHPRAYIKNTNVQWFRFMLDDLPTMDFDPAERAEFALRTGDVLVCEGGEVGRAAIWNGDLDECYFQKALHRVRPDRTQLLGEYFVHFLYYEASRGALAESVNTATIPHLTGERLKALSVPLPPIEEQRRIAAILDKADELRAKRRAALAHLDSLAQAIFLDMFGDPFSPGDARFPSLKIRDVARVTIGPFGTALHQSDYVLDGVPFVNPMHISGGRIKPDPRHGVGAVKYAQLEAWHLREGDLVVARRGEMGRCAVVGKAETGFVCGSGSLAIRPDPSRVVSAFLQAALSSEHGIKVLEQRAQGVTMLNLNSTIVENLEIKCPPVGRQLDYVSAVDATNSARSKMDLASQAVDNLFASLQHRAFEGTL